MYNKIRLNTWYYFFNLPFAFVLFLCLWQCNIFVFIVLFKLTQAMFNYVFLAPDQKVTTTEQIAVYVLLDSFLIGSNLNICRLVRLLNNYNYHAGFQVLTAMLLKYKFSGTCMPPVLYPQFCDLSSKRSQLRENDLCRAKLFPFVYFLSVREKQYTCELYWVWNLPCALLQTELCAKVLDYSTCHTFHSPWSVLTTVWIIFICDRDEPWFVYCMGQSTDYQSYMVWSVDWWGRLGLRCKCCGGMLAWCVWVVVVE